MMSLAVRTAAWAAPIGAALAWFILFLPSNLFYQLVPPLSHPLWVAIGAILVHVEPLSRQMGIGTLTALLPLALGLTAASLFYAGWRFASGVLLALLPLTGLPYFWFLYVLAGNYAATHPVYQAQPSLIAGTLLDRVGQRFHAVPDVLPTFIDDFGIPVIAGLLSFLFLPLFRRLFFVEPVRKGHIRRSTATKWMDGRTERKMVGPGLTLGRRGRRVLVYPYSNPAFYGGHHFAFAGTRGGKGVSVVIPALIDHDGPTSTIDIKGENWLVTREARRAKGYDVLALNPYDLFERNEVGCNPFDFLRRDHISDDAKLLASALIREETNEVGAHLVDLARKLLSATIEVVRTVDEPKNHHLMTAYDLIMGAGAKDAFTAWSENPQLCGGRPARAVGSFLGKDEKEFNLVKSTISRNLGFLDSDRMQTLITTSGLKPAHILSGKCDLFTITPLEHLADLANFLRLVTALQLNTILSSAERRSAKPLLMVLDEFPALGAMAQMKNLFTVGAGSNLVLLGITQDLSRLQDVWGRDAALSMLSQCATLRVFGLGAGDIATAEWAARLLPEIVKKRENRTYKADKVTSDHVSYADTPERLIPAEDILRMGMDSMLCIVRGKNPLLLDRIISHEDPLYEPYLAPNPYVAK